MDSIFDDDIFGAEFQPTEPSEEIQNLIREKESSEANTEHQS